MIVLIDVATKTTSYDVDRAKRGTRHFFGGTFGDAGLKYSGRVPLQLLFAVNAAAQDSPFSWADSEYVPFCYAFALCGDETVYRVVGDTVKLVSKPRRKLDLHFPYEDYPAAYPRSPISFGKSSYRPSDPDDVVLFGDLFGLDKVTPRTIDRVIDRLDDFGYFEDLDLTGTTKRDELFEDPPAYVFLQGPPEDDCPNPDCAGGKLEVIALQQGDQTKDVRLWEKTEEPDDGNFGPQLIFQRCLSCGCFRATNQAT